MNDAVAGLVWLLVNGLLAVAAWRVGGRCFPGDGARQRVIHALIIGWAIVADPDRERIAVCEYRYYAFLGSRRQFDVCRPLWLPDQAALLGYLDDQGVTILVARPRDPQAKRWYAKYHDWLADRPDFFETIYEDSEYLLTRVGRERLANAIAETGWDERDSNGLGSVGARELRARE